MKREETRGQLIDRYIEKRQRIFSILKKIKKQQIACTGCEICCLDELKQIIENKLQQLKINIERRIIKRALKRNKVHLKGNNNQHIKHITPADASQNQGDASKNK